jgi:hypothetical protein
MGDRLPATIQPNQRSQGPQQSTAPAPQSVYMCSFGFSLAIPLPFAHQERRTVALLVRRFAGAFISFDLLHMEIKRSRQRWQKESPLDTRHFCQAVVWLFLINAMLYVVVR